MRSRPRYARLASLSGKHQPSWRARAGVTLIELLVVLTILSILAVVAIPYAEITVRREKEFELRGALREIRSAIDVFHEDWEAGRIPHFDDAASQDGYPVSLEALVDGVEVSEAAGGKHYYLRRVPRDPFGDSDQAPSRQWVLRSYADDPRSAIWGGQDVYDVRSGSELTAIDGTKYGNW